MRLTAHYKARVCIFRMYSTIKYFNRNLMHTCLSNEYKLFQLQLAQASPAFSDDGDSSYGDYYFEGSGEEV